MHAPAAVVRSRFATLMLVCRITAILFSGDALLCAGSQLPVSTPSGMLIIPCFCTLIQHRATAR